MVLWVYKQLSKDLRAAKAAKAVQTTAPKTTCQGNLNDTERKPSFKTYNVMDMAKMETGSN